LDPILKATAYECISVIYFLQDKNELLAEQLLNWLEKLELSLLIEDNPIIITSMLKAWIICFTTWVNSYKENDFIILEEWSNVLSFSKHIKCDYEETVITAFTALAIFYDEIPDYMDIEFIEKVRLELLYNADRCSITSHLLRRELEIALKLIKREQAQFKFRCYMPRNHKYYFVSWGEQKRYEYIKSILNEGFQVSLNQIYKLYFGRGVDHYKKMNMKLNKEAKWRYIADTYTHRNHRTHERKRRVEKLSVRRSSRKLIQKLAREPF